MKKVKAGDTMLILHSSKIIKVKIEEVLIRTNAEKTTTKYVISTAQIIEQIKSAENFINNSHYYLPRDRIFTKKELKHHISMI